MKALPNIPQEVMSGLMGKEIFEEKFCEERDHFDIDTIDLNIGVCEDEVRM